MLRNIYIVGILLLTSQAFSQEKAPAGIPDWFEEHIAYIVGEWKADNSPYKGENEPYEAYGMRWEKGIGGKSVKGTLYGILDGKETAAFWEFRTYWHPGEKKVYAVQFGGNGVLGIGEMLPHQIDQTFFALDGTSFRSGHKSENKPGKHWTASFIIDQNGKWTPRREYTWDKVR